mgnify:CR=1 FL=1
MQVLWLSPTLNHYKRRFLSLLSENGKIDVVVLAGTGRNSMGDVFTGQKPSFRLIQTPVSKARFGFSVLVLREIIAAAPGCDWIMIPREKKNIPLICALLILRWWWRLQGRSIRLVSYNHPILKSGQGKVTALDRTLTKLLYRAYDRIIFYTEQSRQKMVDEGYIAPEKAFWANNTIATNEVMQHYEFCYPPETPIQILFIGRLIANKRLKTCFAYYEALKAYMAKKGKDVELVLIGDGPQAPLVQQSLEKDSSISWVGAIVEEDKIAPYMGNSSLVFNPGHSGLSINHAFVYGRPYATIEEGSHGPELDYIQDGTNGFLLQGDLDQDVNRLSDFLLDRTPAIYDAAWQSGQTLNVEAWVSQIEESLLA